MRAVESTNPCRQEGVTTRHAMNSFNLLKFFTVISGVLASIEDIAKKLDKVGLYNALQHLPDTLEEVQAIFEMADENFNNDFWGIHILLRCCNQEIFKYVLSKSVNMNPIRRVNKIGEILDRLISSHIPQEGETLYVIAMACLDALKGEDLSEIQSLMAPKFIHLVLGNRLDFLQKFVEVGIKVPASFPDGLPIRPLSLMVCIKFIIENGYDMSEESRFVYSLMKSSLMKKSRKINDADFQLYLDHGLPLDYQLREFFSSPALNWLELALQNGCLDVAALLHSKGLRLSNSKRQVYSNFQDNIKLFVENLAKSAAAAEAAKMILVHGTGPETSLNFMPSDLISAIAKSFEWVASEKILEDLYR